MNTTILFATLHLHAGHEGHSHTLSKTSAVYHNDRFEFLQKFLFRTAKEIKATIRQTSEHAQGQGHEVYPHFVWHLN